MNEQKPWRIITDSCVDASGVDYYAVHSMFLTFQGEGPSSGRSAVFIRLAGCNLQCPGCDTIYTGTTVEHVSINEIIKDIEKLREGTKTHLIVITGGEPFRQPIGGLVEGILKKLNDVHIEIETNGTIFRDDFDFETNNHRFTIICSPKTPIHPQFAPYVDYLKYVIRAGEVDPDDGLPTHALEHSARPGRIPGYEMVTFVQPYDEKDPEAEKKNIAAAIHSCRRFGYRLSVQTHKILGLP